MTPELERLAQLIVKARLHGLTPDEQREQAALRQHPAIQQWVAQLANKSKSIRR